MHVLAATTMYGRCMLIMEWNDVSYLPGTNSDMILFLFYFTTEAWCAGDLGQTNSEAVLDLLLAYGTLVEVAPEQVHPVVDAARLNSVSMVLRLLAASESLGPVRSFLLCLLLRGPPYRTTPYRSSDSICKGSLS